MAYPTNPIYKFFKNPFNEVCGLNKANENSVMSIPLDEANSDYQAYLEWAKTNTAEAAD